MSAVAEIKAVDQLPVEAPVSGNPLLNMLSEAIRAGQPIEVIREIKNMVQEIAQDEARKAFVAARSAAKGEIPAITKNRLVDFSSSKGRTRYRHEDLAEIIETIDPILAKHGLSYEFVPAQTAGKVTVTCVLSHEGGYSKEYPLTADEDQSGNKNSIQGIGSTITFLSRYTLKAALGLAASNDDDGQKAGKKPEDLLKPEQIEMVRDLIDKTDTDIELFCQTFKVQALTELRVIDFDSAVRSLNIKLARKFSEAKNA